MPFWFCFAVCGKLSDFVLLYLVALRCHSSTVWYNVSDIFFLCQSRIKKIMQADEDIGKIALAVPVLVCKFSSSSH